MAYRPPTNGPACAATRLPLKHSPSMNGGVRQDGDRLRLRRVRDRHFRPADRRLAGEQQPAQQPRAERPGAGAARPGAGPAVGNRGSQYPSTRYTQRLAQTGIATSISSRGDSYDNAPAETSIRLYKTEVIHHLGPWRDVTDDDITTLERVHRFNHQRLPEPIGATPPTEFEQMHYPQQGQATARLKQTNLRKTRGGSLEPLPNRVCTILDERLDDDPISIVPDVEILATGESL